MAFFGTPAQQAFWGATLAVAAIGALFGDRSVRTGAALVVANFALSGWLENWVWQTVRIAVVGVDGALFALLFVLAWKSRRWWAHAATAFALLGFFSHFIAMFDQSIWWRAYVELRWYFSAILVLTLLFGVLETPFARRYEARLNPTS